jgi:hypothetical protein
MGKWYYEISTIAPRTFKSQNRVMPNGYQKRKAKRIAGVLMLAAAASDTPMSQLALLASRMDQRQWITVSLQAGVAVADHAARVLIVAYLSRLS